MHVAAHGEFDILGNTSYSSYLSFMRIVENHVDEIRRVFQQKIPNLNAITTEGLTPLMFATTRE